MTKSEQLDGRLIALNWSAATSGQTMAVDTSKLFEAVAEIEDSAGMTHRIEVLAGWDADYLVGKDVRTETTEQGLVIKEKS